MEKTEFEFQYYYRRWLGALPCLAIAVALNFLLSSLPLKEPLYFILCAIIIIALMAAYYEISKKWDIFRGKGYYWIENDILCIQTGKQLREITNVMELLGDAKSVFGSRYAVLLIEMGKTNIKLFSPPLNREQGFEDSSLYPLYLLVRSRAEDLKPVKVLGNDAEHWYRK